MSNEMPIDVRNALREKLEEGLTWPHKLILLWTKAVDIGRRRHKWDDIFVSYLLMNFQVVILMAQEAQTGQDLIDSLDKIYKVVTPSIVEFNTKLAEKEQQTSHGE